MKNYPIVMSILAGILLSSVWPLVVKGVGFFYPCESFGCIGLGILSFGIYGFLTLVSLICFWIFFYTADTTPYKIRLSLSSTIIISLIAIGMFIGINKEKNNSDESLKDAYEDCISTFTGKAQEYCTTYRK